MRKLFFAVLAVAVLAASGIATYIHVARHPAATPAVRGKRHAEALGCFACHGAEGSGGVADPTSPGGTVPDWRYTTLRMFVKSEQDIAEWILYGAPRSQTERPASEKPRRLIPMPGYEGEVDARQLADLVAYVLAVSGWRAEIPDDAYEGWRIATRLGCFGCHGPSGMGGVANPGSFQGHIASWDGSDFAELVRDDGELREWILEGRIPRLWNSPAARVFLDRQKTTMPAYHDHLSDAELDQLVAYIHWLRAGANTPARKPREASTVIGSVTP